MALPLPQEQPAASRTGVRAQLALAPPSTDAEDEQRRWIVRLGLELVAFSIFLALLFGTGVGWFIVPAMLSVAIAGPITLAYLAITSDTNQRREIARTERRTVTPTGANLDQMRTPQDPTQKRASK